MSSDPGTQFANTIGHIIVPLAIVGVLVLVALAFWLGYRRRGHHGEHR